MLKVLGPHYFGEEIIKRNKKRINKKVVGLTISPLPSDLKGSCIPLINRQKLN